jgi:4-hydroxybenzoate polyprenyltransferase
LGGEGVSESQNGSQIAEARDRGQDAAAGKPAGFARLFSRLRQILEMIRFSHTVFALPFALLAAVMAWTSPVNRGRPDATAALPPLHVAFRWCDLLGILLCMVAARSAAMAFNRIADRRLDAQNPRTSRRHIPAGVLPVKSVAAFTVVSSVGFATATLLFLPNWLPLACSLPVLAFLLTYSYAKRFTALSHFWLGAALMLAPIAAWIAVRGVHVIAWPRDVLPAAWLGAAVLFWVAGFDMIYACQDTAFDIRAKLYSVPAAVGVRGALRLAAVCHLAMLVVLSTLPWVDRWGGPPLQLGWIYGTGIASVGVLLAYEHYLVTPEDLTRVNIAFFHVNAVVSLGLFAVGTVDLLT